MPFPSMQTKDKSTGINHKGDKKSLALHCQECGALRHRGVELCPKCTSAYKADNENLLKKQRNRR